MWKISHTLRNEIENKNKIGSKPSPYTTISNSLIYQPCPHQSSEATARHDLPNRQNSPPIGLGHERTNGALVSSSLFRGSVALLANGQRWRWKRKEDYFQAIPGRIHLRRKPFRKLASSYPSGRWRPASGTRRERRQYGQGGAGIE